MEAAPRAEPEWWKKAVFYQVYPASFKDSNADGFGDLPGIVSKLDYLAWLGIDAIWLSPVFRSPFFDMGYDITDYKEIDPHFGSLDNLKELLKEAHRRGIRIILDLVMNHTSSQHPWFLESRTSKENPKRNWYIWKDGIGRKKPNNWKSVFGGSAWEYDELTGQYYYHTFFKQQPDLNWRNKSLREEFFQIVRYWLDMGVDGFRLDVINMIVKDKKFRNAPSLIYQFLGKENNLTRNRPKSYKIVRRLREVVDEYEAKMMVGEIYTLPPGKPQLVASYLAGENKGLHMAFDFSLMFSRWNARSYFNAISAWMNSIPAAAWPCHVLSNHDLNRPFNATRRNMRKDQKTKILAALLLTLKGTPFLYYGDEIGMRNAKIPKKKAIDPLARRFWPLYRGRDRSRTPMQWDAGPRAGFTQGEPWLPVNKDFNSRNVGLQMVQKDSILRFYKQLLKLRRNCKALQSGEWVPIIKGERNIIAYLRICDDEKILTILNFSSGIRTVNISSQEEAYVLISTHRETSEKTLISSIRLFPFEASLFIVETQINQLP